MPCGDVQPTSTSTSVSFHPVAAIPTDLVGLLKIGSLVEFILRCCGGRVRGDNAQLCAMVDGGVLVVHAEGKRSGLQIKIY